MEPTPYVCCSLRSKRRTSYSGNRKRLYVGQEGKCRWCGKVCKLEGTGGDPDQFTVDHVIALRIGGTNHWMNMVGSCFACNNERNRRWARVEVVKI